MILMSSQIALIYTCARLVANLANIYMPIYLQATLFVDEVKFQELTDWWLFNKNDCISIEWYQIILIILFTVSQIIIISVFGSAAKKTHSWAISLPLKRLIRPFNIFPQSGYI